jgi:hypothetical protein
MSTGARQNRTFVGEGYEAEIETPSTAEPTLDVKEDSRICANGDEDSNSKNSH